MAGAHEEIIEASVASWLAEWGDDDPRSEMYETNGVVVRRPCVAFLFLSAGETSRRSPEGWRHDRALVLATTLCADMPHPLVESLMRKWNSGLQRPLEDAEMSHLLKDAFKGVRVGCHNQTLQTVCCGKDSCDYHARNFAVYTGRPFGAAAIYDHGRSCALKCQDVVLYEGICRLERVRSIQPGQVLVATYRDLATVAGISTSTVKAALARLGESGYLTCAVGEAKKGGNATEVSRSFPLPLHLNGDLASLTITAPSRSTHAQVDDQLVSDVLERFLEDWTIAPEEWLLCDLEQRGLSADTVSRFRIGYFPPEAYDHAKQALLKTHDPALLRAVGLFNKKGSLQFYRHHLLIPYVAAGRVVYIKGRRTESGPAEDRYMNLGRGCPDACNLSALDDGEAVVVCEGEFDTMSVAELGLPAIGIPQAKEIPRSILARLKTKRRVVLAFDNDEAGRAAQGSNRMALRDSHNTRELDLGDYGDVNEWLVDDRAGLDAALRTLLSSVEELMS